MATNGKKVSVELTQSECKLVVRALDAVIAQVNRSIARESDARIVELRKESIAHLVALQNQIAYGGKELL